MITEDLILNIAMYITGLGLGFLSSATYLKHRKSKGSKEYILCSAIRRLTPKKCTVYWPMSTFSQVYSTELGFRHCDILERFKGEVSNKLTDQGFITSIGRFVDRKEAAYIAYKAGQIPELKSVLYSEDLY